MRAKWTRSPGREGRAKGRGQAGDVAELKEGLAGTEPHTLSDLEVDLLTFYARTAALGLGSHHIHDRPPAG